MTDPEHPDPAARAGDRRHRIHRRPPCPRLVDAGHRVRALARNPDKISDVPWAAGVEVVRGDFTDPDSLDDACGDIDVVYYLVHSMGGPGEFIESERRRLAPNLPNLAC